MTEKILVTKWKKRKKWLLNKETSEISRLPAYIVSINDMDDIANAFYKVIENIEDLRKFERTQ